MCSSFKVLLLKGWSRFGAMGRIVRLQRSIDKSVKSG
jgi:hypothetical protein